MKAKVFFLVVMLGWSTSILAQDTLLDNFNTVRGWKPITSDGVSMSIGSAQGYTGRSMVIHFQFHGGSGYAIAEKAFPIELPDNYEFTFYYKGDTPVNNFELKLLDSLGNVFWIKQLNIHYPGVWTRKTITKDEISFAWGPSGGGIIRRIDSIQFVVSAGIGGKGTIYIDDFRLQKLIPNSVSLPAPIASASSYKVGHDPAAAIDGEGSTSWQSLGKTNTEWFEVDRQQVRDLGGLTVKWEGKSFATHYIIDLSDDGERWAKGYEVLNGNGGTDYIYLHHAEARYVKLDLLKSNDGNNYSMSSLVIHRARFGSSLNAFYDSIVQDTPTGYYPKYFTNKQSYWTLIGANGDSRKGLMNEEGQIEVGRMSFSIEPFLYLGDSLLTWHSFHKLQSLAKDYLPIPSVTWTRSGVRLRITGFAEGKAEHSVLMARYIIENTGKERMNGKFFVAIRPFQVNPPWQFLNNPGGVSEISDVSYKRGMVSVDNKRVISLTQPQAFGATTFDSGDITEYLLNGIVPRAGSVHDHFRHASGALEYGVDLAPGEKAEIDLAMPFYKTPPDYTPNMSRANSFVHRKQISTEKYWNSKVSKVDIELPGSAQDIINTIKSNLAYILINRHGPAIQPGARSYDRSWIRDGALMSAALLRFGLQKGVRDFIDWYTRYIYPNGKVPCVVDSRGADPVPENDSPGEYIYAVMQYFRFTHDTTWLRDKLPAVEKVVHYIQLLRAQEMTEKYRDGYAEQQACFGLVPASISHEGYSNHPEHSYWDDFFVLLGLKDATDIAKVLHETKLEKEFATERDDFRKSLYVSLRLAMKNKEIDYIPGCVELGDFDPTSTTIAVDPCGELENLPEPQLRNTFAKYYDYFHRRRENSVPWEAYTPYETRIIGTFVQLGEKRKANELMDYFMHDRRPQAWNEWAEVVWKNPDAPKFIGDMPHTWVGSDFIRSVRAMFAYERESDTTLVVGAGIPTAWISDTNKVVVKGMPTYYGTLGYTVVTHEGIVEYSLSGGIDLSQAHVLVESPCNKPVRSAKVNGIPVPVRDGNSVQIEELPAKVEFEY